jgi:hypothetical protein
MMSAIDLIRNNECNKIIVKAEKKRLEKNSNLCYFFGCGDRI